MALRALALTMLLPISSVFAAQPSWGQSAWNTLTSPFALQTAGTLGSIGAANYLRSNAEGAIPAGIFLMLPLLASYLRYNQRTSEKPEERSHWSSYIINPMAANAAGLLSYYALTGNRPYNLPVVLALATAIGASFGSTSGYSWSFDEEFKDAEKNLTTFIETNFANTEIDLNELNRLKEIYEQKRSKVLRPGKYLSANNYMDYLILNKAIDEGLLVVKRSALSTKPSLELSNSKNAQLISQNRLNQ